jgi:Ala-tRNA(Pro) deacylase
MTISKTLQQYLEERGVEYEVLKHAPTPSSSQTAQASHISGTRIAKGVVLKDDKGYLLAVLPASHHIQFDALEQVLHRRLTLATEEETGELFSDCELGAVPAIGSAYGLDVVLDDSLSTEGEIYFEGGDHASLLHVGGGQLERLIPGAQHASFSRQG